MIDITEPGYLQNEGSFSTPNPAYDVVVTGSHAYVAEFTSGHGAFRVIDITNPVGPLITSGIDTPRGARGVAVSGNHAYVVVSHLYGYYGSLQVFDISYAENAQIIKANKYFIFNVFKSLQKFTLRTPNYTCIPIY